MVIQLNVSLQNEIEAYARNAKVFTIAPEYGRVGVLLTLVEDSSISIGKADKRVILTYESKEHSPLLQIYSAPEGQQASLLVQLPLFYSPQGWLTSSGQTNYIFTIGEIQTNTGCYKTLTQRLNEELNHHLDLASCGIILC